MTAGGLDRRAFLRRSAQAAIALGSSGALLAACGDSGGGDANRAAGTTATPTTPTTLSAEEAAKPWFLRGNFAPVPDEVEVTDLEVKGRSPRSSPGLYVRNGSNPLPGFSPHWFLGDGMVHGVLLDEREGGLVPQPLRADRAARSGRWARGRGRAGRRGRASATCRSSITRGKLLSLGEVGLPYEIAPSDLSHRRSVRLRGQGHGQRHCAPEDRSGDRVHALLRIQLHRART